MRPTQSDVHVNRPLSSILVAFMQDDSTTVSRQVFPVVPVSKKTDLYYKWKRDDFWRIEASERAPGTQSEGGGIELEQDSFICKEYAIHKDLEWATLANEDEGLRLEEMATRYVAGQLNLKREQVWLSTYFATSVWTGGSGGVDFTGVAGAPAANQFKQWDQATSTPLEDIRAQIVAVQEKTTKKPNTLVLGPKVWQKLQDHPELLDRIKYTQRGQYGTELLASLLEIDRVLIAGAVQNTAKQGQTGAFSFMAGKAALLCYAAANPAPFEASAGYTFAWTNRVPGAGPDGQFIRKFDIDPIASTRIEGEMSFAHKVVAPELGVFFTAAVA